MLRSAKTRMPLRASLARFSYLGTCQQVAAFGGNAKANKRGRGIRVRSTVPQKRSRVHLAQPRDPAKPIRDTTGARYHAGRAGLRNQLNDARGAQRKLPILLVLFFICQTPREPRSNKCQGFSPSTSLRSYIPGFRRSRSRFLSTAAQ